MQRLKNPKTKNLPPPQQYTRNLNGATFQNGDQFRDSTHEVSVAFLGGRESFTMLFSKQELTGAILQSNLRTSSIPFTATYGEQISLTGTLVGENGTPLAGQTVGVGILDPESTPIHALGWA